MYKLTLSALLAGSLLAGCGHISSPGPLPETNPSVFQQAALLPVRSDIHQGNLANGMKYIVLPNAEPAGRVSLQLIVHAGSLHEDADQKGIAHLVEHMAFNGSEQFPGNEIIEHQEALGMVFGRDVNAMTEYYTTSYYLHLPKNSESMLNEAFNMFSQQVSALTFDQEELEKERPVVEEEWRRGLNMMARLGAANRKMTLAGSRFGDREPIGDMDLVRNIEAERIKAFYDEWYHPNNMTLLVVGSVEVSQIETLLNKYFAAMPVHELPARPDLTVPLPKNLTFDTILDNEITTEVLSINLRGPQAVVYTEDDLKAELINTLAMTMMDNRLRVQYQTETNTISKMVASAMPLATGYSNNRVMTILKDGHYFSAMEEMFSEISRYSAHGFSQRDLDTARKGLSARYRMIADGQDGARNSRKMMTLFNQIRMGKPLVHWNDFNEAVQRILASVSVEDVNQHFQQTIHQRTPLVIAQVNTSHQNAQPTVEQVKKLWEKSLANPPAAIEQEAIPNKLFANAPEATKVLKYQQFDDIHKWTLGNGAQVWFQYSDEVSNQVQLRWQGYGGTMQLPPSERRAATLAARNLSIFGYGGFDAEALAAINAAHNIRQIPYVDLTSQGVFGTASNDAVEQWLQNLNLMLTEPQVDELIWKGKQDFMARSIERRKENPTTQFNEKINRLRYINTPSLQPITGDELRAITPEQLLAAYKTVFGTADGHQLVVIGDIKADQIIDLASRYLGHLPAGQPHDEPLLPKLIDGRHRVRVEGGVEPQGITSVLFNADYPYSYEAENIAYLITRIVSQRMREQLREEAGGVYTTRFGISLERSRQQAYGMISYSHQPERASELNKMALNIIAEVAAHGVTEDELSMVREQLIQSLQPEVITSRDRYRWLSQMAADDKYLELPGSYLNWLKEVTPADLQPMASTILSTNNVIDALLLPENKS